MSGQPLGTILDSKYRLEEKIGQGGMSTVYRATHLHMDTTVAIKILDAHLALDGTAVERFRREARAAAQLRHPNVVAVMDFGVTAEEGTAYFVMEFLEGEDLRRRLTQKHQLDYVESCSIMDQACAAVHAAHLNGIIHRDLKPDNIWLSKKDGADRVKVLDFGIAKLKSYAENTLTSPGLIVGTPYYMSPEQCRGEELDPRSDIYSLGVILYEMLTGKVPFEGTTPLSLVLSHTKEQPRSIRELRDDVPERVEKVVLRALAKDPSKRQVSAIELAKELRDSLDSRTPGDYKTIIATNIDLPVSSESSRDFRSTDTLASKYGIAPPVAPPEPVVLDKQTVHLTPPNYDDSSDTDVTAKNVMLRHAAAFRHGDEHLFEELVLHRDYERLWRSLIHAGGGRNLLTGYGPFGGTSLVRCAIVKARTELQRSNRTEAALLVFYFRLTNETDAGFEIEATHFGLSHLNPPGEVGYNSDLNELFARAEQGKSESTSSVLELPLENPLGAAFFSTPETSNLGEATKRHNNFSELVSDINAFFKQRKPNKALRQIVLRLVRSESLSSRVVFIIDRIKHLQTLESLFRSEMFSNRRIRVIAVSRKEDFDSWMDAEGRLRAIEFSKWYVPCLWNIDWDRSLFDKWPGVQDSAFDLFLKHLIYVGRGSLGNIINELRQPINTIYDNNQNFIDLASLGARGEVRHNSWMQEMLELNWDTILGNKFGGPEQDEKTDRARIGVYFLIDWLSRKVRFSEQQLIKVSKGMSVSVSDDELVRSETIRNLLYVLSRHRYLTLEDDQYSVIWNKNRLPLIRKVSRPPTVRSKHDDPRPLKSATTSVAMTQPLTNSELAISDNSQGSSVAPVQITASSGRGPNPDAPARDIPEPSGTKPLHLDKFSGSNKLTRHDKTLIMSTPEAPARSTIFVSYSHADRKWLERLQVHIRPLEHSGKVELWDDTRIQVGAKWNREIENAIFAARVAILLVSADFLASRFISNNELPPILASSEVRGTIVMPLIVSHCMFEDTHLAQFQSFNAPSNPLSAMDPNRQEELFKQVAKAIKRALSGA